METSEFKISVRELVSFCLKKGDINSSFVSTLRAQDGVIAHKKLQKDNEDIYDKYIKEVYLKYLYSEGNLEIAIEGRADGIIFLENDVIIEEIKSTNNSLENIFEDYNELHWAQAMIYAYIYLRNENLSKISVMLSYFNLKSGEVKSFRRNFTDAEIESFFNEVIAIYTKWIKLKISWDEKRDSSIKKCEFPFQKYREGQRELAVNSYLTIKEGAKIFVEAPTGIGKTISTIFPAVKSINEKYADKIFYLTAKTISRKVAEEAFNRLRKNGLKFKTITLTAKEKICFNKGASCTPDECSYAENYYEKVRNALFEIFKNEDSFERDIIEKYSNKYEICPFEFSLDISRFCDGVICDYNYVFHPTAYLKRFFDESKEKYIFLIDEAHNLVQRGRDMYSEDITKSQIEKVKKQLKSKFQNLYKYLNKISSYLCLLEDECLSENKEFLEINEPIDLYKDIKVFLKKTDEFLVNNKKYDFYNDLVDLYFKLNSFLSIGDKYDKNYTSYAEIGSYDVKLKLFCVNPRKNLKECMRRASSCIIFSATLEPLNFFKDVIGGDDKDYSMRLNSPFDKKKLFLKIYKISTKFKSRNRNINPIIELILEFLKGLKGNAMIFFPSYEYMNTIYNKMITQNLDGLYEIFMQNHDMDEVNKEKFLKKFNERGIKKIVGFCVIGGMFSEGIDLVNKRLEGAVIIGAGLPKISYESDIIKKYYDEIGKEGYDYAYTYPGMNRVMQAAGRVIRTENDKGVVILVDDRYDTLKYYNLMPKHWNDIMVIKNIRELSLEISRFMIKDN